MNQLHLAAVSALLLATCASAVAGDPERYIFITSTSGTGNLGSWPEAFPATGLDAGDKICQTRAADAELPAPETYVAWLSDSANDAYCRAHGLYGTRFSWCGQAQPPGDAGPWIRIDGLPALDVSAIAFGLPDTAQPVMLRAIQLNEFGEMFAEEVLPYTGSTNLGTLESENCDGWLASGDPDYGHTGSAHAVAPYWTSWGSSRCDQVRPLICLSAARGGTALDPIVNTESRLAFVTSETGRGNLGEWPSAGDATGVAAGDRICRRLARDAGLDMAQYYRAWLSTSTQPASSRFTTDGPWYQPNGLRIADNMADLIRGDLDVPIVRDENGIHKPYDSVWTGTSPQGQTVADMTCGGWRSTGGNGASGWRSRVDGDWTYREDVPEACANEGSLYCFADRAGFFYGGFEDEPVLD